MRRNRYGLIGAIATILTLAWSGFLPWLSPLSGLGFQPVQATPSIVATPARRTETSKIASLGPEPTAIAPNGLAQSSAPTQLEQGKLAYRSGHFTEAVQRFQQASQQTQSLEQAYALSYLSLAQQQQGDWAAAQQAISQSLELSQRFPRSHAQQLILGRALNTQGSLYFYQGNAKAALATWQQAETAYSAAKDNRRQLGSLLNQSQALQSLGYYGRSRRTLEEVERRFKQEPAAFRLLGQHNLGVMYWRIGELEKSKAALGEATKLAKEAQDLVQQSGILLSLGNTEQAQGDNAAALQHYQQAASLGTGEVQFQATLNQFRLLVLDQERATAQALIPVLQRQLEALPVSRRVLYGATNFAESLTRLAFPQSSRDQSTDAQSTETQSTETQSTDVQTRDSQTRDSQVHEAEENQVKISDVHAQERIKTPALKHGLRPASPAFDRGGALGLTVLKQAKSVLSRPSSPNAILTSQLPAKTLPSQNLLAKQAATTAWTPRSQAQLAVDTLSWVVKTADSLGDIRASAYGQGYLGHIYELSEQWEIAQALTQQAIGQANRIQAKDIGYQWEWQSARIYQAQAQLEAAKAAYYKSFDMLQSLRSDLVAVQPDLQFSFREQVAPVYREFVDLLLQLNEGVPQDSPESAETLKLTRQVLESLQIAELNNFFHAACIQDQVVSLEEVEHPGTAVLYPIILPDRLTIIWDLPGEALHSSTFPVKQGQVEATLRQLRNNLELNFTSPEGKQAGADLYNWLIKPIDARLKANKITTLTFVLDGNLQNVPMAALYDREHKRYLVEDYSIALTPGLRLFEPKPLNIEQVLLAGLSESRHELVALPYVEEEVKRLSKLVPSEVLLNQAFTRESLENNVMTSGFSVVHLATHGEFSSDSEKTYIAAWDDLVSVVQLSAALRGRDRPDPIELLILSACKTANGDDRAALGLAGVAVQAGARSTLASLWNLDDESGSQFVQEFYHALVEKKMGRAEALREAQLTLLKSPKYRHPMNWAPYVLLGSWL